ncbi:MAG TPA: hypothetical protein VED01_03385 [Burkholderiales bacterium]|nr:hypothetical protein [Burkholderiales bacterium]
MGNSHAVTPVHEFDGWKREGERKLQQLVSYREGAEQRLQDAREELAKVDAAIAELSELLTPGASPLHHRVTQLEALLLAAHGDFSPLHPLYAKIGEVLRITVGPG